MVCVAILYHVLSCHFEYWWNRCMYCNMFVTFTARLYGMASCGASCKKSNWMWHMEVQCSVLLSDGMLFNVCVIFIAACSQIGMRSCQSNCWKRIQRKMQTTCRHKLQLLFDNCSFETHTHTDTASRSSAINLTRWIHPLLSPEPCELLHGLGFTKQMMQKARERTARAAKYWYYLLHCFFVGQSQNDLLRWQGCFVHYAPQGTTHTHIYTYILYIIIYLSGRHHGLMDFAPATQWPWHFWKNAIATLATQMHHAQRRFKDTDSNFEILWEVLSQLWGHEGHVWWLAYACCTRSSLVCRAYASASWWVQLSSAQSSFALRKMYSLRLFPTVFS